MKSFVFYTITLLIFYLVIMAGCQSTYETAKVKTDNLQPLKHYPIQAKAFLSNDNILIYPEGFTLKDNNLVGPYIAYDYKGTLIRSDKLISLDSIVAITQYIETTSGGMRFADALSVLTGTPLTIMAGYCLLCPKCCFGSCPTVYVPSDEGYVLQAELFSKSISQQLEEKDLDMLDYNIPSNGEINLKITNEALETHYINKFNLVAVTHPPGTKVYQTNDEKFIQVGDLISNYKACSGTGKNLSEVLYKDDEQSFRSDENKILELRNHPTKDFIELSSDSFFGKDKVKMLIKYRNTLLTTVLLYDVVIGSQGINALEWTRKMNEDKFYAMQFKTVYDLFSGISIECKKNSRWVEVGKFQDAGPINWKYSVAEIPVDSDGHINVRLNFFPDNIMIDYIAFDTSETDVRLNKENLKPAKIIDYRNQVRNEVVNMIDADDSIYLVTNPGDSYLLQYNLNRNTNDKITLFIESKGFYNEWIRGNWIKEKDPLYSFNLFDVPGTFNKLVDSWFENKNLLEKEFFNSRIPLKEEK